MRFVNQFDILVIYSLFDHYTSTCFGLASCTSSEGNDVYMQQLVRVVQLVVCQRTAVNQNVQHVPIVLYIYPHVPDVADLRHVKDP
jgi:hypothetical protein